MGNSKEGKRVIGIDPGYAITGYGILELSDASDTPTVLEYGVIRTAAHTPLVDRLAQMYSDLEKLLTQHKPTVAGCEKVFYSKNVKTATDVNQARGVILLALAHHNNALIELTPTQIKQSTTGYGAANKKQVQYMTQQILKLDAIPQPDDAADALAIAIAVSRLI